VEQVLIGASATIWFYENCDFSWQLLFSVFMCAQEQFARRILAELILHVVDGYFVDEKWMKRKANIRR
jgi:hypothetical protein